MFTHTRLRVFLPLLLIGLLGFGAAAEARQNRDDRVAKGAVIGAAVGTFLQLANGRNEGRDILTGAVVGGALGAAAGAITDGRRGYYRRDGYRDGYYGYGDRAYSPSQEYYVQGGYEDPYYGYDTRGYYPAPRVEGRYDRRYDARRDDRWRRH